MFKGTRNVLVDDVEIHSPRSSKSSHFPRLSGNAESASSIPAVSCTTYRQKMELCELPFVESRTNPYGPDRLYGLCAVERERRDRGGIYIHQEAGYRTPRELLGCDPGKFMAVDATASIAQFTFQAFVFTLRLTLTECCEVHKLRRSIVLNLQTKRKDLDLHTQLDS